MRRALITAFALAAACTRPGEGPAASPPPLIMPQAAAPRAPSAGGVTGASGFWEEVDVRVHANAHGPDLPLRLEQIELLGAASARWTTLPEGLHTGVLRDGFAVVRSEARRARLGSYYAELRDARVPFVVTLDALFFLANAAMDRALSEAEDRTVGPALEALLRRLDARLAEGQKDAGGDLEAAYWTARGLLAVARGLLSPTYAAPAELVATVGTEVKRVVLHNGRGKSALLGVAIDYSALAPRGAVDASEARAAAFRAMAWLATAPLAMVARTDERGAAAGPVGTERARTNARAALLLGRLLDPDVDAEASAAFGRVARVAELFAGASDDASPREFAQIAARAGLDPKDVGAIANVARLERARHALVETRPSRLVDGVADVRVAPRSAAGGQGAGGALEDIFARASTGVRLLPPRATPDAEVLQGLVFPRVGARRAGADAGAQPSTARDDLRALPTGLDVAAWLGAAEARDVLHASGDDAYEGYDAAMERLYARRPPVEARHASLYVSALDAIATMLAPSAADAAQPATVTSQWRRRKLGVALAAWAALRHASVPFARFPLGPMPASATLAPAPDGAAIALPAFVEPAPEAIAKLLALVRQTARGTWNVASLPSDVPARRLLAAIEQVLATSLAIASREANDEPLTASESASLAELPARLLAIDAALGASHADLVSMVTDVHTDVAPGLALEEGTGDLDDLYVAMREPRTGRLVLAVGASLPHYELTQPAALRLGDEGWRARLHAASPPPRDAFASGYLVEPAR